MQLIAELWSALGGAPELIYGVRETGQGSLPSVCHVSDLAAAAVGVAGTAIAELVASETGTLPDVEVDRRLASLWFGTSLRPDGWQVPPVWHAVAGDYRTSDGWIRLHANAPHHRQVALDVLQCAADRPAVARAVSGWSGDDLERAIVDAGGCAARLRSTGEWAQHPQGSAVASEPLVHLEERPAGAASTWPPSNNATRPLAGVRVLDLTRVLAGPVATRFLAGFGADVLRIDPPARDEPGLVPEVTLGKHCARLDLRASDDRQRLERLMSECDVLVHGHPQTIKRVRCASGVVQSARKVQRFREARSR